jgi:hypothetical protein
MHKSESCITDLYYGFNKDSLFIRVDPVIPLNRFEERVSLDIDIFHPSVLKIVFNPSANETVVYESRNGAWVEGNARLEAVAVDIFEIEIPFSVIGARENDEVHFALEVVKNGGASIPVAEAASLTEKSMERCPWRGQIIVTVPSPDFEKLMWY